MQITTAIPYGRNMWAVATITMPVPSLRHLIKEGQPAVSSLIIIAENQPVGTIIGEFNATDPDADAILTYTLVSGANDNHLFTLDTNGTLRSAFVYDYENNQSFSIRVKCVISITSG